MGACVVDKHGSGVLGRWLKEKKKTKKAWPVCVPLPLNCLASGINRTGKHGRGRINGGEFSSKDDSLLRKIRPIPQCCLINLGTGEAFRRRTAKRAFNE